MSHLHQSKHIMGVSLLCLLLMMNPLEVFAQDLSAMPQAHFAPAIISDPISMQKFAVDNVFFAQSSAKPSVPMTLVQKVKKDLSGRAKIPIAEIKLTSSEPKTWPDGCLGLAQVDELCSQALVPGWRLVLGHSNQTWVYRTNQSGRTLRLEVPTPNSP